MVLGGGGCWLTEALSFIEKEGGGDQGCNAFICFPKHGISAGKAVRVNRKKWLTGKIIWLTGKIICVTKKIT